MSRSKKSKPMILGATVSDMAAEGKSICRVDDQVVFVTGAVPGDVVDIQIVKKRSNYAEGNVVRFVSLSPLRVQPFCPHFGKCGGCKWQMIPYPKQVEYKEREVINNLRRLGHVELPENLPILPSEKNEYYRNKLEYTFSSKRWLTAEELADPSVLKTPGVGFHVPGLFDKVVDITDCHLQAEPSNAIRNWLRNYAFAHNLTFYDLRERHGLLRNLTIRTASTGDIMVILSLGEDEPEATKALLQALAEAFPSITSLMYVVNQKANDTIADLDIKCFRGEPYITERMGDVSFRVGPKSFYQTNSEQAHRLYDVAKEFASLTGNEVVYDLYTGTGTIANYVARSARKVVGVEYVPEAIEDAKVNSQINGIENTEFFAGDMKDVLTLDFIAQHGQPDVMIVDPPRAGMHPDVVQTILKAQPKRIVYVSCNSATQARDIQMMDAQYKVEALRPVDMFPHTHHVESVVLLVRR
ncbi:MAG: 23S rRNA (uracil(1939)-C(5))-methyltransferase RlmD [Bacteroidales bacterium]|nr:23S rRNA (uracil(1939)-C(5))-methyltransferase RlmD [Bacteroidales bacterium]MDY4521558.1 23S rRNA (uracil(1939)-C(5))-methyltransferase RlmD [Bacteroidales bacterium]